MIKNASLPPEFDGLRARVHYVRQVSQVEYSSSCPRCGGAPHQHGEWPDRFRMFVAGSGTSGKTRAWCRKCNYLWFPEGEAEAWRSNPHLIESWRQEREEAARKEGRRVEQTLANLSLEKRWLEFHKNLNDQHRAWWREAGIPDAWQDFWKLGYTPEKHFEYNGQLLTSPAYTIPKFDFGRVFTNLDFRLLEFPAGAGKYRPLAHIPQSAFFSLPDQHAFPDEVYVVEGSKKAMVLSIYSAEEAQFVVGIPGKASFAGMDARLKECGRVWVILDPDATEWAVKFARSVGPHARVIEMSVKPDEAFVKYGMSRREWGYFLRQSLSPQDFTLNRKAN